MRVPSSLSLISLLAQQYPELGGPRSLSACTRQPMSGELQLLENSISQLIKVVMEKGKERMALGPCGSNLVFNI